MKKNLDKIIKEAVNTSIKKVIKESIDTNEIKVVNVFFKLCEITDEVGFSAEDWAKLAEKCQRQASMRSFTPNNPKM